ncbi:4-hydroxy-3-methylbut-2-enyl diphosphate reductase [bioreactor metagenome]|uniref:4-hydroxy-3-methylbut-2-enyl diphosphate reductase n=1 Tax=bioreactor metagenome TaxID=1076179 RepID=A0A644WV21_9ZZZZ
MKITIDNKSGFCAGVTSAIHAAEKELKMNQRLYCLGDLVHNNAEMERLRGLGLVVISYDQFRNLKNERVLIRAHGEPPSTYLIAKENNLTLLDYSCPVVLKLQKRIKLGFEEMTAVKGQVVIYGKPGHAEVIGLNGQIADQAIIVSSPEDLSEIDFSKPVTLFSQTTKDETGFYRTAENIRTGMLSAGIDPDKNLTINNTICRLVSKRVPQLKKFASGHDIIIFVSGVKSSNGQFLFSICREVNSRCFLIPDASHLNKDWFSKEDSVGICGATSTPMWLMEEIAGSIRNLAV